MEEDGHLALLLSSLISGFLRALGGELQECVYSQGPGWPCWGLPEKEARQGGPEAGRIGKARMKYKGQEWPLGEKSAEGTWNGEGL